MNRFFLVSCIPFALFAKENLNQRIAALEEKMQSVRMESVYGNYGANTASATYPLRSCGVSLWVDALAYKYFVGGTEFSFTDNLPQALQFEGKTDLLDFGFDWGFKVGLAYFIGNPDWSLWSEYTWFRSEETNSVTDPNLRLIQNFLDIDPAPTILTNRLKWSLSYNVLDLKLGRAYSLRKHFSLSPRFGVRGASILQRKEGNSEGGTIDLLELRAKNDLWGIGIVTGTEITWNLSSQWSVFGELEASLLYSEIDVSFRVLEPRSSPVVLIHDQADVCRIVPTASWSSGFRWEMPLFSDRTKLRFALSYDFTYWWRVNQILYQKSSQNSLFGRWSEDIGLMGVKLDGGFDF